MKSVSFLSAFLFTVSVFAQGAFSKIYYSSAPIQAAAFTQTADGSFMILGGNLIYKVDSAGNVLWSETINPGYLNSIAVAPDSGFILGGSVDDSVIGYTDAYCAKMRADGTFAWSGIIPSGGNSRMVINSIQPAYDSGFVFTGTETIDVDPYGVVMTGKLNSAGGLQWIKYMTIGAGNNEGTVVRQGPDSAYYIAGNTNAYPPYAFLAKLSPSGNVLWVKKYDAINNMDDLIVTKTGLLLYCQPGNATLAKVNYSGNFQWGNTYNLSPQPGLFGRIYNKVHQLSDTALVFVAGSCYGNNALIKTDSAGNVKWSRGLILTAVDVLQAADHGYLIAGNGPLCGERIMSPLQPQIGLIKTDSLGNGSSPWWTGCVRPMNYYASTLTASDAPATYSLTSGPSLLPFTTNTAPISLSADSGCVPAYGAVKENDAPDRIHVFPNPSDGYFTIHSGENILAVEIISMYGEIIYSSDNYSKNGIDLRQAPDGVYMARLTTRDGVVRKKIVLSR